MGESFKITLTVCNLVSDENENLLCVFLYKRMQYVLRLQMRECV